MKKPLKIAILGFSREGHSVLSFLKKSKRHKGAIITIFDKDPKVKVPRGVKLIAGPDYLHHLHGYHLIIRSPGIPFLTPELQRAIKHGARCSSATQLFFEEIYAAKRRPTVVGVTGTKGKGTTASLLYQCLKAAKMNTLLLGNIGKPMLASLALAKKAKVVVLELSSFQLQDLTLSPDVAVVLHITPDHLDAHKSLVEYYNAKMQIVAHQSHDGQMFYFPGNLASEEAGRHSLGKKTLVDTSTFSLFRASELRVPGQHNFANAVMAATVARSLGVKDEVIRRAVTGFKGLPYRLALSRTIALPGGAEVRFYNDSAGTNPETAAAAVRSFTEPVVLIAGGKDKRLDYGVLRNALARSSVSGVVLFGENREKMANQLHALPQRIELKSELPAAVEAAVRIAKAKAKETNTSVVILFSPAAASFDMFHDYADRGAHFDAIVKKLKI